MTLATVDTPDAEALRIAVDRQLLDYEGAMPCVVQAVSADGTTVDVMVAVSKTVTLEGVRAPLGDRIIRGVPIMIYGSTTLGLFVCPPIRPGDDGVIVAMDRALDNWQYGEGVRMPPDMQTPRHGDFTDSMFYPGAQRASGAIANYPTDALTIQNRTGSTVASVKDGEVRVMVGETEIIVTPAGITINGDVNMTGGFALAGNMGQMGDITTTGTVTASDFVEI